MPAVQQTNVCCAQGHVEPFRPVQQLSKDWTGSNLLDEGTTQSKIDAVFCSSVKKLTLQSSDVVRRCVHQVHEGSCIATLVALLHHHGGRVLGGGALVGKQILHLGNDHSYICLLIFCQVHLSYKRFLS